VREPLCLTMMCCVPRVDHWIAHHLILIENGSVECCFAELQQF